jgi:hypothetical protein
VRSPPPPTAPNGGCDGQLVERCDPTRLIEGDIDVERYESKEAPEGMWSRRDIRANGVYYLRQQMGIAARDLSQVRFDGGMIAKGLLV